MPKLKYRLDKESVSLRSTLFKRLANPLLATTLIVLSGILGLFEPSFADPDKVLKIAEDASLEEIEKAYSEHEYFKKDLGECGICFADEHLSVKNAVQSSSCKCQNYYYHEGCLRRWLSDKQTCPTCRTKTQTAPCSDLKKLEEAYREAKKRFEPEEPHLEPAAAVPAVDPIQAQFPGAIHNENEDLRAYFNINDFLDRGNLAELSMSDREQLSRGDAVQLFTVVEYAPWPKLTHYQLLDTSPEKAAAIFWDFENHSTFIPNMTASHVAPIEAQAERTVAFQHTFAFQNVSYTNTYQIVVDANQGSYGVSWVLDRSARIGRGFGSVVFMPAGNRTIMTYTHFLEPNRSFGFMLAFVAQRAKQLMADIPKALANQILRQDRAENQAGLQAEIRQLREALNQQ